LDCGNIYEIPKDARVNFVITSLKDIVKILIPMLNKYPLHGIKKLNYEDFLTIVKLIEKKEHLTLEGLAKIRLIKSGMNTGRSFMDGVPAGDLIQDSDPDFNKSSNIITASHNSSPSEGATRPRFRTGPWSGSSDENSSNLINQVKSGSFTQKRGFHNNVKAGKRIGPHNIDVLSVILGSLLGNNGRTRRSVEGTRICYRQSSIHKEYLFELYSFFFTKGYCSNLEPRKSNIKVKHKGIESIHYRYEFNTFTFRSFN